MTPIEYCNQHQACLSGREFATRYATMADVWDNCQNPSWMFWMLERSAPLAKEQSVRLAIAFAETCIHLLPEGEDRPAKAIAAAKAWVDNPCEETARAAYAAYAAAYAADAADAAYAAYAAAYAAGAADAADAAYAAYAAAYAAADAAADAAYAAADAADAANCEIIRNAIPNPFK